MSRKARNKAKKLPYHIMSRSIPELNLFSTDEDKEYYLSLLKTAAQVHMYIHKIIGKDSNTVNLR